MEQVRRFRADVERVGWRAAAAQAVEALLEDVQQAASVDDAMRAFETFRDDTMGPLLRKHFGHETADMLDSALGGFVASRRPGASPQSASTVQRRLSRRLSRSPAADAYVHPAGSALLSTGDAAANEFAADDDFVPDSVGGNEEDGDDDDRDDSVVAEAPTPAANTQLQWIARRLTGYEGNMTAQQTQDLERFRRLMYDTTDFRADIESHPDGADRLLLRYLRAECSKKRRFNLPRSKARLAASLQWRRETGIGAGVDTLPPDWPRFVAVSAEFELMDNEGRLWVFTRAASLAMHMDLSEYAMEDWLRRTALMAERRMRILRESSRERGYEVSAICMVYDLRGGFGLHARRMIPFVRALNGVSATHFPELVDMILVPGASRIFAGLYKVVAPMLDPVTREKIRIYSSSSSDTRRFVKDMLEFIPREELPREYGGDSDVEVPMPLHAVEKGVQRPPDIVVDLDTA